MNYIALDDVSKDFIDSVYTSATICYEKRSRPVLEDVAKKVLHRTREPFECLDLLARYVAETVRWAGYYEYQTGRRLPVDRNGSEEEILKSGFGWCNEQARLFCALAQISGIPARLVFGSHGEGRYGHVVSEALTPCGWMLIDQSFGYCFAYEGRPIDAWSAWHDPAMRRHFDPIYRSLCKQLERDLGHDILARDFQMAIAAHPLFGFEKLGYCNYFV